MKKQALPKRRGGVGVAWRFVVDTVLSVGAHRQFLAGLHVSVGFLYLVGGLLMSFIAGAYFLLVSTGVALICLAVTAVSVRWYSTVALIISWTWACLSVAAGLLLFFMAMAAGAGGGGIG